MGKVYRIKHGGGDRIVSFKRVPGGVRVREECASYFHAVLNPEQVEAFIACLREVAAHPEPGARDG